MYANDNHFDGWMEKLYGAVKEVGKDLKSLIHADTVLTKTISRWTIRTCVS
jgi:hypothetical protein